jgi:uncharacterized integral membrane protein (TIGR00697 family)
MNETLSYSDVRTLTVALALYLVSLFAANTLGLKLMPFLFDTRLSVAVFSFPVVFLMTDVIGEVYGKRIAKLFVLAGFVSTASFVAYSLLSLAMPWSSAAEWVHEGYNQVFGVSVRIALASLVAFAIAEYQDVISFFYFKKMFEGAGNMLWLRSTLSNLWSQFLDTAIFMVIAFAGVYSWGTLVSISIPWWLYKVGMGLLYTPLLYIGVRILKKYKTN